MRHFRRNGKIVSDEQNRHAVGALHLAHEVQDLGLNGHIQCGSRLVGYQQFGFPGQGHGDHDPLLHTAGKLERIFTHPTRWVGNAHLIQYFKDTLLRSRSPQAEMPL